MDEPITNLCNSLNLDKQTVDDVSQIFTKVGERFIFEGDKTHWVACAIYVITNKNTKHNGISLTQLLRHSNLTLIDFLSKMDKWLKMTEEEDIRPKISHLERNFNVSAVVFKKFKQIFPDVFKSTSQATSTSTTTSTTTTSQADSTSSIPSTTSAATPTSPNKTTAKGQQEQKESKPTVNRTRKSTASTRQNYELTTADVYHFCWTLYINIKALRPAISEDLVSSYHLLLACIDFCYANVLVSKFAHDVLNPKFKGLPENFHTEEFKLLNPLKQPMCILQVLCNNWDGIVVEAKGIREHWLKPYLKELVEKKTLLISSTNDPPNSFLGVFDPANFEHNWSKLTKEHDITVADAADFDERFFITENAHKELGGAPVYDLDELKRRISERDPNTITPPSTNLNENSDLAKQKTPTDNPNRFVPQTPLSNRIYLANKAMQPQSPVANATRKVCDLYRMLAECTGEPTTSLEDIFKLCTVNPRDSIMDKATRMVERFVEAYTSDQTEAQAIDLARNRGDLARKLYFKVLETIIVREQKRLPTDKIGDSLSSQLSNEIFHISLFACCIEIVLASHNAKRLFPWIIEVFKGFGETNLYPFQFYRVIEVVIREEERLSRDIVKHLALVEEKILESMAWESDSPLWTAIAANGTIPSCQDVVLPPTTNKQNPFEMSPLSSLRRHEGFQSPLPASGRYSITPLEGGARRRLFDMGGDGSTTTTPTTTSSTTGNPTATINSATSQSQILQVVMPQRSENGDVKYILLNTIDAEHAVQRNQELDHSSGPIRPAAKANPVNLFFRKVYYLAQLRFRDLWIRLSINSVDLQRKIWTLFEDQIRNHTNLLRDRHLDQMIMCATYAVIKVCNPERSSNFFKEITNAYRYQPQADNDVYGNVLLAKPALQLLDSGATMTRSVSAMTTRSPSKRSSVSSPVRNGIAGQSLSGHSAHSQSSNPPLPERGDLIQFYNCVYVPEVKSVIVQFATPGSTLNLSPLPQLNTNPISPWRRVSQQHSVFVSPLKSHSLPASPGRQLSYNFHRSPSKDLQTINNMINKQRQACKRILQDEDGENTIKRNCISVIASKKVNDIMNDRRN